METHVIAAIVKTMKGAFNLYTSDGRIIYVDHQENILISSEIIVVSYGLDGGVVKDLRFLNPDQLVRIEAVKRRPVRKVAPSTK